MYKQTPKFRKQLNQNQLELLHVLYRYRFASRELIATNFNKKDVYRQLLVLEDRGLIGRRYEPSYRLAGKPAAYYLKPAGMRELQNANENVDEANIKKLYKAKEVSEEFISHCMTLFAISLRLKHVHPTIKYFTKIDLQREEYGYFPTPLPDAYIRIDKRHYFLNYIDGTKPFFAIAKWIKLLEEYYESGIWDDTGTEFPLVVIVLEDGRYAKKLSDFIEDNLENIDIRITLKSEILKGSFPPYSGRLA